MELNLFKVGVVQQLTPAVMPADPVVFDSPAVFAPLDPVSLAPLGIGPDTMPNTQPLILDAPGTQQTTGLTYIESTGNFIDSNENPLTATWKWYNKKTGEIYATAISTSFHVWGDTDLDNVALYAEVHGYRSAEIMATQLQPQNNIIFKKVPYLVYLAAVVALIAMAKKKKKEVGAVTMQDILPFLYIAGGVLAFTFVKQILEALGIWKSKETKGLDTLASDPNSFWSPNFYLNLLRQGVTWTTGITATTADEWLKEIENAMGFFGDNESIVMGVLKRCQTQATFSFLAWEYNYNTGGDFLAFLRGRDAWYPWAGLSDTDIYSVSQYISNLPKY